MKTQWMAALALALGALVPSPAAALDSACDIDLDGAVTGADVQMIDAALTGHALCPTCDVNNDGEVTVADAELATAHLLGMESCPLTADSAVLVMDALIGTKALVYLRDASGVNFYFVTKVTASKPGALPHGRSLGLDVTGDNRPDALANSPAALKPPVPVTIPGQPPAVILSLTHPEFLRWKRPMTKAKSDPRILLDLDSDGVTDVILVTVGAYGW